MEDKPCINRSLDQETAFALYRLPHEEDHFLIRQNDGGYSKYNLYENEKKGFVFHPFTVSVDHPTVLIRADQITKNDTIDFSSCNTFKVVDSKEQDQLNLLDQFIKATHQDFKKIICSRIKLQDFPGGNLFPLFLSLKQTYPTAFVYLINIPNVGCWMGASPEVFISKEGRKARTVALAGTQSDMGIDLEKVNWGEKEIEEQAIVEQYIEQIFINRNLSYQKIGPRTVKAGQVLHLQSVFNFKMDALDPMIMSLLHPSPAVCGIPKGEAKKFILNNEPHDRAYYCGFLGPMNIDDSTHLFVNLRCMQVLEKQLALYLGGGITKDSDPIKEWNETELKAQTLLSVIEKNYQPLNAV